jgi:hypothetical protein
VRAPFILLRHAVTCLFIGVLFFLPLNAWAEFYKYKDNSGNLIITNRLEDVPKKYLKRVKVVWDKDLEAKDPLARRRAEAEKLREQREQRELLQEQRRTVENKNSNAGKTLVITFDEETGQLVRKFE